MSETDCSKVSKPIPPFGVHQNNAAPNTAGLEEANTPEPHARTFKIKALQAKTLQTEATETKAIEAGTLETLRSLSQSSSALTTAIDDGDRPVPAQQAVSSPSERISDTLATGNGAASKPIPKASPPPLYFLVVNYHNAALISDLLYTLEANQGIILINNSPVDRVIHGLAGQTYAGGTVTVLDAPSNVGFSAACNLGLEWIYARSPNALVWLIKSDAQLVPRAVASVRQCFTQRPDLAILGTPILNASGKPWFAAGAFNPWLGLITSQRLGKADVLGRPIPTRWVSSGSMVFNFAVLGHCPQFDDTYFLYYEDCDLCERYFQQGAAIALTPSPLIMRSATTALSRYTYPRHANAAFSRLTFLSRHGTPLALGLNLLVLSAKALVLKVRDRTAAQGCWQGIQRFLSLQRR
ncbi:MAG: hypothetical protein AAFP03_03265 [Cyanobacteria bacterium J06598_3]